jgi:ribosomal protein L37AE/L43A
MSETTCRFAASNQPRAINGRHEPDCADDECRGCQPCEEVHCVVCRRTHAANVCAECVAATRDDLRAIAELCGALPTEVAHRGVNGEAMMLLGPAADPEAWRNRAMSAMRGRVDAAYLDDCRDEQHPLWILGTWEQAWRDHLDQPTDLRATLPRLVDYLDRQLHVMAGEVEVPFDDFARDLRGCRSHLEDVLHDGIRKETGAPCPECNRPLVKRYGKTEAFDTWVCPSRRCGTWYTDHEYRTRVTDDYRANADRLTVQDMAAQYGVSQGSVRGWASQGKVHKRGKDDSGRQLYDVGDVVRLRDGSAA